MTSLEMDAYLRVWARRSRWWRFVLVMAAVAVVVFGLLLAGSETRYEIDLSSGRERNVRVLAESDVVLWRWPRRPAIADCGRAPEWRRYRGGHGRGGRFLSDLNLLAAALKLDGADSEETCHAVEAMAGLWERYSFPGLEEDWCADSGRRAVGCRCVYREAEAEVVVYESKAHRAGMCGQDE